MQAGGCIAYVKNVAVDSKYRRQALGTELLQAARHLAGEQWQASHLLAHVERDNEVSFERLPVMRFVLLPDRPHNLLRMLSTQFQTWQCCRLPEASISSVATGP